MQQPAEIQKAPINITTSKYFSQSCHIYSISFVIWVTQQKISTFCRFLLEKLKIEYAGAPNKSGGLENFSKKKHVGGAFIRDLRVEIDVANRTAT